MSTIILTQPGLQHIESLKLSHLGSDDGEREAFTVVFDNCSKGLGIKIAGGCSLDGEDFFGIFVKRILSGGLAERDGRLRTGDQLLEVNGESLEGVTNARAVIILRHASASSAVTMVVSRDEQARGEFMLVLERQNSFSSHNCTPVPSKASSRATTPLSSDISRSPRSDNSNYTTPPPPYSSQPETSPVSQKNSGPSRFISSPEEKCDTSLIYSPYPVSCPSTTHSDKLRERLQPNMASTPQNDTGHGSRKVASKGDESTPKTTGVSHSWLGDNPSPVISPSDSQHNHTLPAYSAKHHSSHPHTRTGSQHPPRKLSLDPHCRLRVEKLEVALRYLGLEPTVAQQEEMRHGLKIDEAGTVNYGDFVTLTRNIFRAELDEKNLGASALLFSASDLTSIMEPPPFKLNNLPDVAENLESVKKERDFLRTELDRLKCLLNEKEQSKSLAEDEILRIRKEAQGAIHESRSLRSKIHLAEQAQKAARSMEQDYEDVVHLLEAEIIELKGQFGKEHDNPEWQKRLALLTCQLNKSETTRKTYEVATEKLLQFVEHVHETLRNQENGIVTSNTESLLGEPSRGSLPPGYLGKHKSFSPKSLASEAREIVKAIKSLTDTQPLPYGWEEAYTTDSMKYYINHLTQLTTWSHPISNVQHLPSMDNEPPKMVALT